jgi:hypothetical protein
MSDPAGIPALQEAIRHLHGLEAKHVATEHVHETHGGETVWRGDVEIFEAHGGDGPMRVYAWSEITGANKRRFFAVLGISPIANAVMAVRGSILQDAGRVR